MKTNLWKLLNVATLLLVALLLVSPRSEAAESTTVKIPVAAELYANDPAPLTVADCARCHTSHFKGLQGQGGRHRFDCQGCHQVFHAYNPTKGVESYRALMPNCASCHAQPHGREIVNCAGCHQDPHAILSPIAMAKLTGICASCHPGPKAELAANPSKHTKVACDTCHTAHGYKPQCNMCHQPHYPTQGFDTCATCHQVHKPTVVTYSKDTGNATCAACHGAVAETLRTSATKHAAVSCAACHQNRHKAIPKCTECHAAPHEETFLRQFPNCLTCHQDPHNPLR